jgi:hypothetical protein
MTPLRSSPAANLPILLGLPIRLAAPQEVGLPFSEWLMRRFRGDRRATERQLAFLQQWDHLRDGATGTSLAAYATRWRASRATTYRLLEEFRSVFPAERDPNRLLGLLWDGLSEGHKAGALLGSLMEVRIVRTPSAEPGDLRELLPAISEGELVRSLFDGGGRELLPVGARYEAYEHNADRFAWAASIPLESPSIAGYVGFILESDADDSWLPAPGSVTRYGDWEDGEVASAARWAQAAGMRLQRIGVRLPSPSFRPAPGSRGTVRRRDP